MVSGGRLMLLVAVLLALAAPALAANRWGNYVPLGPAGHAKHVALSATGELIVVVEDQGALTAAVQPPGGGPATTQPLGAYDWLNTALTVDGGGVAWFARIDVGGTRAVEVSRRSPGGGFALDRTFDVSARDVGIAANPRGDVLLVWATDAATFASRHTYGGAWSEPVRMPPAAGRPDVRLSDSGWGLIAWSGNEGADLEPARLVTLSPGGTPSEPVELQGVGGGPVAMAVDDAGNFAVGGPFWREAPLHVFHGREGRVTGQHALGVGSRLRIAANRHGDALLSWMRQANLADNHDRPSRMRTMNLRDGGVGPDEPAPLYTDVTAMTDAGDRLMVGGTYTNYASRARAGGLLRAVVGFGCDLNPAQPLFAGIDPAGQAVVVSQPIAGPWPAPPGGHGPHVVRDAQSEFWGPLYCFTSTSQPPIPTLVKAVAGRPALVSVAAAADPEASRQRFHWDLQDDGVYDIESGESPEASLTWPAPGRTALRVRQQRWFGDALHERSWRIDVEVAPPPPAPSPAVTPVKPRLTVRERSLRRAMRHGLRLEAVLPFGGRTRFEMRRRHRGSRTRLLAQSLRTLAAGTPTKLRLRLPRRVRRLESLRLEIRAHQHGRRVVRTRATLR